MKQFDPNKPYCRRDGKPAKIVHKLKDGTWLVIDDDETAYRINDDGHRWTKNESKSDLVNIPETLDRTRPVQLRNGRKVKNIDWEYPLADGEVGIKALTRCSDDSQDYYWLAFHANGRAYLNDMDTHYDLINVPVNIPEKIEGSVNIYKHVNGNFVTGLAIYLTYDEAIANVGKDIIACIKVSFTEGEGLNDNQP